MTVSMSVGTRLDELIDAQEQQFMDRQPASRALLERAAGSLAGGVTSSWQISRPQAVWISHGRGSRVWDADGNEYVDLHGGYGVMAVGHAHPAVVAAVSDRVAKGTHFAQPTSEAIVVAEELKRRFGLPLWRFANSGTEATMDAVHLMRAITGRSRIIKVEGCYHGHHDSVQVSVYQPLEEIGPAHGPASAVASSGIPAEIVAADPGRARSTTSRCRAGLRRAPRRDRRHDHRAGDDEHRRHPAPARLPGGARRAAPRATAPCSPSTRSRPASTAAPGGAAERFGVVPDIVCLAKALGGGLSCGAIGGTEEVMDAIAERHYDQVGTFNGNPLTMAAVKAALPEILTPAAYATSTSSASSSSSGSSTPSAGTASPAYVSRVRGQGCVVFSPTRVRNYRDFLRLDDRWSHCHWLYQHNGGVFLPPWGKAEQWTLSAQHTGEDVDRFLANFAAFADDVSR